MNAIFAGATRGGSRLRIFACSATNLIWGSNMHKEYDARGSHDCNERGRSGEELFSGAEPQHRFTRSRGRYYFWQLVA